MPVLIWRPILTINDWSSVIANQKITFKVGAVLSEPVWHTTNGNGLAI